MGFVAGPQALYNLTVAEAHTYFVGAGQWLVHNGCKLTKGGNRKIGNLIALQDVSASEAIRLRGGGASQVNQLQSGYESLTVGE
ncbi:MAG: hypothetical protein GWN00_11245, partial [Aliifodinibius sp.]|nr:hypothetical protein [Fodinibius sp.]NIW97203.1 hypothetical protein [Phycisphaerae bacterium]NIY25358.1 hypothetical protein [Fodinibius sp.]